MIEASRTEGGRDDHHCRQTTCQQIGGSGGGDEHRGDQSDADGLQRDNDCERDEDKQNVFEQFGGQAQRGGENGVERNDEQFFIQQDNRQEDDQPESRNQDKVGIAHAQHIPKQNVREVERIGLDGADERDAEREGGGEQNADGGILFDGAAPREKTNAKRHNQGGDERANQDLLRSPAATPGSSR